MTTENELVFSILSSLSGTGLISDDVAISEELVYFRIINNRAFLIRQDQEKGRSLSDNILQTFCVPIEQVDISQCPCKVSSDCTIYRSIDPLPEFLECYQKDLLTKVSGVDISSPSWSIISYARASRAGKNKYTKSTPKVFLHNQYLYLINIPNVNVVSVSGVLSNPRDASVYNCAGAPCYSGDERFPVSAHMLPVLQQLVLKDFGVLMQASKDERGDERYDKSPQETQGK